MTEIHKDNKNGKRDKISKVLEAGKEKGLLASDSKDQREQNSFYRENVNLLYNLVCTPEGLVARGNSGSRVELGLGTKRWT